MNRVRYIWAIIFLMLIFIACGNKIRQTESVDNYNSPVVEQPDTVAMSANVTNNSVNEENNPSSVFSSSSSSSHSHKSNRYDNMRGFDPASEDDMEDNGMSRYMENNDEEGWD